MTKRILDVIDVNANGAKQPLVNDVALWNRMMTDVQKNNTWCPDIIRIIFNVGERDVLDKNGKKTGVEPTLATTVFFNDNTKVTCLNSVHDKITLVKDPKTGVMTASSVDKERGIVYCTVKKLISTIDPDTLELKTEGFGRILRELVDSAWDQKVEEKAALMRKAASKAAYEAAKNTSKAKAKPNASLHDTVNRLADAVEKLATKVDGKDVKPVAAKAKAEPKKVATKKSAKKQARKPQKRNAKGQFI